MKYMKRAAIGLLAGALCITGTAAGVIAATGTEARAEVGSAGSIDRNNPTRLSFNVKHKINTSDDKDGTFFYFKTDSSVKPYRFEIINDVSSNGGTDVHCYELGTDSDSMNYVFGNVYINRNNSWIKTYENELKPNTEYMLDLGYSNKLLYVTITHEGSSSPQTDANVVKSYNGKWTYFNAAGNPDYTFTGVAKNTNGKWLFVRKGVFDASYTGVAKNTAGTWVYVKKGYYYAKYTGVARATSGKWVYVIKGKFSKAAKKSTGVAKSTSGNYVYVENGVFKKSYTGLAKSLSSGSLVYVKKGKYYTRFNGRAVYEGKAYTVVKGRVPNS